MSKRWVVVFVLSAIALAACGDDGSDTRSNSASASGSGSGSGSAVSGSGSKTASDAKCEPHGDASKATTSIPVSLSEFKITLTEDTAPAGLVHFELSNVGAEPHEFVVVKGVAPDELPLDADGALDESALPDGALIGEVEPFPGKGETCDGTFELSAGDYTLLCNIVETEANGEVEAHLHEKMVTTFTVT